MEKKNIGLGVAALAAGAGAVALAAKNHKDNVKNEVKKAAANASFWLVFKDSWKNFFNQASSLFFRFAIFNQLVFSDANEFLIFFT